MKIGQAPECHGDFPYFRFQDSDGLLLYFSSTTKRWEGLALNKKYLSDMSDRFGCFYWRNE